MAQWTPPDYAQPVWQPPDYATPYQPAQTTPVASTTPQEPQENFIEKMWRLGNIHPNVAGPAMEKFVEPLKQYGESGNGLLNKAALYGGTYADSFTKMAESMLNPINAGLTVLSGGSNLIASEAAQSANFANKIRMMQAAKALEVPGRLAAMGMVGHGAIKAFDYSEPTPDRLGGVVEAILGSMGIDSKINVPRMDILPAEETGLARTPKGPTGPITGNKGNILPPGPNMPEVVKTGQMDLPLTAKFEPPPRWVPPAYAKPVDPNFNQGQGDPELAGSADLPLNQPPEEPSFMRVPGSENVAMGGADPRVLKTIGSSMYSRDRPSTVVKELLQNSFDEHRIYGQKEPIKVLFNDVDRHPISREISPSVTVNDKGRGLTRDELYTIFTDVGKTGKEGIENASGGFGFAKAAPMLTGDYFRATSIVKENGKKIKYVMEGTPAEMLNQKLGVPIKKTEIMSQKDAVGRPQRTGEEPFYDAPTGMTVTTWFPQDTSLYNAKNLAAGISKHSPSSPSPVHIVDHYGFLNGHTLEEYLHNPDFAKTNLHESKLDEYRKVINKETPAPLVDTIKIPGSEINIHYKEPSPNTEESRYNLHVLNKGMYQETHAGSYSTSGRPVMNVPSDIIADIKATVEEGEEGYPYTTSRENLDSKVKESIDKWIEKNITSGALEKRRKNLEDLYSSMPEFRVGSTKRPTVLFDPGNRLTPKELLRYKNSSTINNLVKDFDRSIDTILNSSERSKWSDRVERTGIVLDPGMYGVHIPNPFKGSTKSVILINPLAHIQNNPTDPLKAAWGSTVTMLHEVAHVGTEGYSAGSFKTPMSEEDLNDPRLGPYLASFLKHMQEQGGLPGHDLDFVKRLGEVFTKFGTKNTFGVANAIHNTITDGSGGYNGEIQELLQIYSDSRGRPATTTDYLSGTGIKHAASKGGKGTPPGDDKPNKKRTPPLNKKVPLKKAQEFTPQIIESLKRLEDGIKLGLDARTVQDKLYSIERARRADLARAVTTPGLKGYYEQLGMLRGELPKVPSGSKLSDSDINNLMFAVTNSDLRTYEQINAKTGLVKIMSGKAPQKAEVRQLSKVFGPGIGDLIMLHGGLALPADYSLVKDFGNLNKSLMASLDLSGALRQGLPLITRPEYLGAFVDMFKLFGSEQAFQDLESTIHNDDFFDYSQEHGLFIAGLDDELDSREEQYLSPLAEQIPVFGRLVRGSERSYVGFLNKLRFDVFKSLIDEAHDMGHVVYTKNVETGKIQGVPTDDEAGMAGADLAQQIAKFVNVATGRGSLRSWEKIGGDLNLLLFSPKQISSRLTMLNPVYYAKAHPFVRKQALIALFSAAAAGMTIAALLNRRGGSVSLDPTSSDWGKARFGNTREDTYGGFQQYVVAAARLATNKSTSTTGRTYELGKTFTGPTQGSVMTDLIRHKESPLASFVDTMLQGKRAFPPGGVGALAMQHTYQDPTHVLSPPKRFSAEVINRFIPMIINDLVDMHQENPELLKIDIRGLLGGLGVLGGSLQTFGNQPNAKPSSPSSGQ